MIQSNWTDDELDSIFENQDSWEGRAPCFGVDRIVEISFGEGCPEDLKRLARHAAECRECRRDWGIARELRLDCLAQVEAQRYHDLRITPLHATPGPEAIDDPINLANRRLGKAQRKRRLLSSSLLASAAALCFMTMELSKGENEEPSVVAMRSAHLAGPALDDFKEPTGFQYRGASFEWPIAGDGCSYTVSFYSEQLDVLFQTSPLKHNQLLVDQKLSSKLEENRPRYWSVLATGLCRSEQSGLVEIGRITSKE